MVYFMGSKIPNCTEVGVFHISFLCLPSLLIINISSSKTKMSHLIFINNNKKTTNIHSGEDHRAKFQSIKVYETQTVFLNAAHQYHIMSQNSSYWWKVLVITRMPEELQEDSKIEKAGLGFLVPVESRIADLILQALVFLKAGSVAEPSSSLSIPHLKST